MVFMLDQSGSVGVFHHEIALQFLQDVVAFYNISTNATQVEELYLLCIVLIYIDSTAKLLTTINVLIY